VPIGVIYSARTPEELVFRTELERLARRQLLSLTLTVTGQAGTGWAGARGRIAQSLLQAALPSPRATCYLCGPPPMVDAVPPLLRQLGVTSDRIRLEEW
jgi:ferredoxin-NADP reductase